MCRSEGDPAGFKRDTMAAFEQFPYLTTTVDVLSSGADATQTTVHATAGSSQNFLRTVFGQYQSNAAPA